MMSQINRVFVLFLSAGVLFPAAYFGFSLNAGANSPQSLLEPSAQIAGGLTENLSQSTSKRDFGSLPLYFTIDRRSAEGDVKYYSVGSRYGLSLTQSGAVTFEGNAVIVGQTTSFNFPTVSPVQNTIGGGQDAFLAKIGVAADLEIVKTDERDPVMVNNPLVYNLQVKNNGPSAATGVVVTNVLPVGVNFVSATPTQGNCAINSSTLTCNLGNLAFNGQANIRLTVTPTQAGTISSTVTVSGNEPDPVAGSNSDTEQTVISALPSIFGRVTTGSGQPAGEVGIFVEGLQNRTAQTNSAGVYSVSELPLAGNYTVRPVKAGFYFSPRSKSYNSLTRDETADFVINTCSYTLSANSAEFSAAGGNKSVSITANDPFCSWTATSNAPWLSITSGSSGFGNGTVKISIQPSSVQRTGTLTIAGQNFTVTQSGCSFSLMPFQQSFNQNGGAGTFEVRTNQSFCQWSAAASDPWITITNGSSGTGNGIVSYTVSQTTRPRNSRIIAGGQFFSIYQEFNFCPAPRLGTPIETPAVNLESFDIVAADFNNDAILELATVDETATQTSTFSVYRGNGDGTFIRNSIPTNIGALTSLAAGDFNLDSNNDLAIAGAGKISIYIGDGTGPLPLLTTFNATTSSNTKIFPGDFNRDGKIDLLVGASNGIYLYNGNGNGTFTAGPNYPISGRYTYSFAVGDINGDGATDVVVGNEADFNVPRLIYFFGSANGTFSQGGIIPLGAITPFYVETGDLNGDGRADVITNGFGGSQIQVFLWNPAVGGFNPPSKVFTEPFVGYLFKVADINNDGINDIITANNQGYKRVNILRGNGNGTFRLPIGSTSVATTVNAITTADFNRDGRIDVGFAKENNQMAVQLNQCDASATTAERIGTTKFDFDGDGKADVAVVRPADNTWYISKGADQPWVSKQFGLSGDIPVPADFDGDGRTDIAVFRPSDGLWYRLNSSDDSLSVVHWGKSGDIPVPADFDGDERSDLAVFRPGENVWYWVSSLNGQIYTIQFGLSEDIPVTGDYDGDAKADIAVFRPSDGNWYWLKSSNGDFQSFHFGLSEDKPVPADYDGDGKTDFAVFRPSENIWYIMKSSLNQFFALKFGASGDIPTPADYDGDGKTDIAVFRNGIWYVLKSASGDSVTIQFGVTDDKPVPSMYIR